MDGVLTTLKTGKPDQPLFLAHGMGGSANEFTRLVNFIRTGKHIYGFQAKGNDGVEEPLDRLEDLAAYYVDAVKKVQPAGPYFFAGFSLGGLVVLQMARQLSSKGEAIARLVMIDSYPHPKHLSLWQRFRLASRRNQRAANSNRKIVSSAETGLETTARAYQSAYAAWEHYKPRYYPGRVHFVKAEMPTIYPDDPKAVWRKLARDFEVQSVPGDHHQILNTHFETLGSLLSRYLAETVP